MPDSPIYQITLILMIQMSLSMSGLALGAWWLRPESSAHRYLALLAVILQIVVSYSIIHWQGGLSNQLVFLFCSGCLMFVLGWVIHNLPVRMVSGARRPPRLALIIRLYAVFLPQLFLLLLTVLVFSIRFEYKYRMLPDQVARGLEEAQWKFIMPLSAILEFSLLSAAYVWGAAIFAVVVGVAVYRRKSVWHDLNAAMMLSARMITIGVVLRLCSMIVSVAVGAWLDDAGIAHFFQYLVDVAWELMFVRILLGLVIPYLGGRLVLTSIRRGNCLQAAATLICIVLPVAIAEILGSGLTIGLWGITF
jgi:hypothetical protein